MLIGITGKKYAGKTTIAKMMAEYSKFQIISFATSLKDMVVKASLLTHEEAFITKPEHARFLLQHIGTNLVREQIDPDFWVKKVGRILDRTVGNVVIDDVRFINEAEMIRSYGGSILKVTRPGSDNDQHRSEIEMDKIDYQDLVENDGTLDDLRTKLFRR